MKGAIDIRIDSPVMPSLFLVFALSVSGCATALHGTTQKVSITSQPPGAAGVIEPSGLKIVTPTKVQLRRKQNYTVHLELRGYKPQNAYLHRVLSPAFHGNILIGGLIGMSTDLDNGAAFELIPEQLEMTLEPDAQQSSAGGAQGMPPSPESPTGDGTQR